jgi:hypothetical protein
MSKSGMYKILPIAKKILIKNKVKGLNLTESKINIFLEVEYFNELADPEYAYEYKNVGQGEWEFNDRFSNTLGVSFDLLNKYFEAYYIVKDLRGNRIKLYDYEMNKDNIDPTSFQGGPDEHRSDTICKILLDEVVPNYLLNSKPSIIKLHPLSDYRQSIFWKCAKICKEKYNQIEIKQLGKEILLINK